MTVSTWAIESLTTLILESLFGAPPVTLATLRAASSVFSSFNCLQDKVRERKQGMSHSMSGLNNVVTRYAGAGQKRLEQFKKRASRSTDLIEQVTFASSAELVYLESYCDTQCG